MRDATVEDAAEVRAVAAEAWRDTYDGFLKPETIEAFIDRSYSFERIERRIANDAFLLALDETGRIVAFADGRPDDEHFDLLAIYARPAERGRGAGSALLAAMRARAGTQPMTADVLIGNRKGETFYEARGFEPRETLEIQLFDEVAAVRRWWLEASPS